MTDNERAAEVPSRNVRLAEAIGWHYSGSGFGMSYPAFDWNMDTLTVSVMMERGGLIQSSIDFEHCIDDHYRYVWPVLRERGCFVETASPIPGAKGDPAHRYAGHIARKERIVVIIYQLHPDVDGFARTESSHVGDDLPSLLTDAALEVLEK